MSESDEADETDHLTASSRNKGTAPHEESATQLSAWSGRRSPGHAELEEGETSQFIQILEHHPDAMKRFLRLMGIRKPSLFERTGFHTLVVVTKIASISALVTAFVLNLMQLAGGNSCRRDTFSHVVTYQNGTFHVGDMVPDGYQSVAFWNTFASFSSIMTRVFPYLIQIVYAGIEDAFRHDEERYHLLDEILVTPVTTTITGLVTGVLHTNEIATIFVLTLAHHSLEIWHHTASEERVRYAPSCVNTSGTTDRLRLKPYAQKVKDRYNFGLFPTVLTIIPILYAWGPLIRTIHITQSNSNIPYRDQLWAIYISHLGITCGSLVIRFVKYATKKRHPSTLLELSKYESEKHRVRQREFTFWMAKEVVVVVGRVVFFLSVYTHCERIPQHGKS